MRRPVTTRDSDAFEYPQSTIRHGIHPFEDTNHTSSTAWARQRLGRTQAKVPGGPREQGCKKAVVRAEGPFEASAAPRHTSSIIDPSRMDPFRGLGRRAQLGTGRDAMLASRERRRHPVRGLENATPWQEIRTGRSRRLTAPPRVPLSTPGEN